MNKAEKLILFPCAMVQVRREETGVKVNWELDQLPLGEPEIVLLSQEVRVVARDSEKLRVLSLCSCRV
jgi:urease gamma subunit